MARASDLVEQNAVIADTTTISRHGTTVALIAEVTPQDMAGGIDTERSLKVMVMLDGSAHANRMRRWIGKAADDAAAAEARQRGAGKDE